MTRFLVASLVAFSVACGGSTTSPTDTGNDPADTTDTTTDASTDTTPSTNTDTGWECNEWYPCQDCGGVACAAEITACTSLGACGDALNAWAACVLDCGNPVTCAETFVANGGGPAQPLLDCVTASCADVCDL